MAHGENYLLDYLANLTWPPLLSHTLHFAFYPINPSSRGLNQPQQHGQSTRLRLH